MILFLMLNKKIILIISSLSFGLSATRDDNPHSRMEIEAILGSEIINEIKKFRENHIKEGPYDIKGYQELIALSRRINKRQFDHSFDKMKKTLGKINLYLLSNRISIPPISNDFSDSKSGILGMIKKRAMSLFYPHRNSDYSNFLKQKEKEEENLNNFRVAIMKIGIQFDELESNKHHTLIKLLFEYSSDINRLFHYKGILLNLDEIDNEFKEYKNKNKHSSSFPFKGMSKIWIDKGDATRFLNITDTGI